MAKKAIRPIRVEGNVAYVPLTKGYEAIIDAEDAPMVDGRNWRAMVSRNSVYAVYMTMIATVSRATLMHRALMSAPGDMQVDHINGNGLDNRRANLRLATVVQNAMNRGPQSNNTSGFKGVTWEKRRLLWRAKIRIDGKERHLGYFPTREDAHSAYAKASATHYGAFGRSI